MVNVYFNPSFQKKIQKIKDISLKDKLKKQIKKIIANPLIGKHMKYDRKGTREIYIKPFRLAYAYIERENKLIFLELYHKDDQ